MIRKISFVLIIAFFASCAEKDNRIYRMSNVRGQIPGTAVLTKKISRVEYSKAINSLNAIDRLRLVPILINSKAPGSLPEYRLFDIQPGGAPALLGLINSDVLVSANDFVIYEPSKFKTYLQLLQNERTAEIEIRREGQPILFKYTFE